MVIALVLVSLDFCATRMSRSADIAAFLPGIFGLSLARDYNTAFLLRRVGVARLHQLVARS